MYTVTLQVEEQQAQITRITEQYERLEGLFATEHSDAMEPQSATKISRTLGSTVDFQNVLAEHLDIR